MQRRSGTWVRLMFFWVGALWWSFEDEMFGGTGWKFFLLGVVGACLEDFGFC